MSLVDAAKAIRDAFHYDPGHSDLDDEQPIHIHVTLGDWRRLNHALYEAAGLVRPEDKRRSVIPLLQKIRRQRDELADVLRWLDSRGGLGLDVHKRISKALEGIPTAEQQLRNIAEGIGMTYEELMAAASSLPQVGPE
jgi:hypothetical protein